MSTRIDSIGQAPRAGRRLGLPTSGARLLAFLGLSVLSLGLAPLAMTTSAQVAPRQPGTSGTFVPVTPFRILDTRSNTGGAPFGVSSTDTLQITGSGSGTVPTTGVTAVVANVTALKATSGGYLQVFPASGGLPAISNLNFAANQTVPNLVTVPLSSTGQVSIHDYMYNQAAGGSVQVLMDIEGYYTTSTVGSSGLYNPITPVRIADTRTGSGQPDAGTALASKSTTALTVTGTASGVPTTATAVVLNVTVVAPTASGFLTVWPAGASQPTASNLNFVAGETVANRVIVGVGSGGQISIYNSFGTTQLVVDVNGWYTGSSGTATGSAYFPVSPVRVADTRSTFGGTTIGSASTENFTLAGTGGIPATGATAAVLNVTAVGTGVSGYLTVYPSSATKPVASDVNWPVGIRVAVPNLTQVGLGTAGAISIFNGSAGGANVIIDVFGYFGASNITGVGIGSCTVSTLPCPAGDSTTSMSEGGTLYLSATSTSAGVAESADTILYTLSGAACGSLASATGTTGANGTTLADAYTAPSATGTCTVTATSAKTGSVGTLVLTTTIAADTVTITPATASFPTGSGAFFMTATVCTISTVPCPTADEVSGDNVTFSVSGAPAASCPTVSSTPIKTNASGQAEQAYTPTSTSGFCTVTATEANTGGSGSVTYDQTNPSAPGGITVGVASSPTILTGGGTTSSTITITVASGGLALANDGVQVSVPTSTSCGSLSSSTVTTNSSGVATVTYQPASAAGTCQITATEAEGPTTSTAGLSTTLNTGLTLTPTSNISIKSAPAATQSLGGGAVLDVVSGQFSQQFTTASLSLDTALVAPTATASLELTSSTASSAELGESITLTSGTNTQTFVVSATTALTAGTPTAVPVTSQPANFSYPTSSSVSYPLSAAANPVSVTTTTPNFAYPTSSFVVADGSSVIVQTSGTANSVSVSPSTIETVGPSGVQAYVVTVSGSAITGDHVAVTVTPVSAYAFCGTVSPASAPTNGSNQASFAYIGSAAPTSAGFCQLTFTETNDSASASVYVYQTT